jgi:prepilin-type N-terminal cleavage/methylation domain-containing protein
MITKYSQHRGFTLIELLVVISIIGMLASVVLVALNGARNKGKNARIQQEVLQIRNQIETDSSANTYPDLYGTARTILSYGVANNSFNANITTLISDILAQNGGQYAGGIYNTLACGGSNNQYRAGDVNGYLPAYQALNGLTIYTDNVNGSCGSAKKYAIYAAYGPVVGSNGYFCIDSSGGSISNTSTYIPEPNDQTNPVCQ